MWWTFDIMWKIPLPLWSKIESASQTMQTTHEISLRKLPWLSINPLWIWQLWGEHQFTPVSRGYRVCLESSWSLDPVCGFSALLPPVSAGSLISEVFHVAFKFSHSNLWKEWKQTLSVFMTVLEGRLNFKSDPKGGWKVSLGVKRKLAQLFSSHCALKYNLLFPSRDTEYWQENLEQMSSFSWFNTAHLQATACNIRFRWQRAVLRVTLVYQHIT